MAGSGTKLAMVSNYSKNLLFGYCQKRSNLSLGKELSYEKSESRAKCSRYHNEADHIVGTPSCCSSLGLVYLLEE